MNARCRDEIVDNAFDGDAAHRQARLGRAGADVRRAEKVGQLQERRVERGFGLEHIAAGGRQVACGQALAQCRFVDDAAARGVDGATPSLCMAAM